MPRYWAIAPWPSDEPQVFDQVWRYDLANNVIAIGWDEVGDPRGLTLPVLRQRVGETYPGESRAAQPIWDFYNEIQLGDIVFAKRGRKFCVGVGTVVGEPAPDHHRGREMVNGLSSNFRSNFMGVEWRTGFNAVAVRTWFPRKTLTEVSAATYPELARYP